MLRIITPNQHTCLYIQIIEDRFNSAYLYICTIDLKIGTIELNLVSSNELNRLIGDRPVYIYN